MAKKSKNLVKHPKMKCLLCIKKIKKEESYIILEEYNEEELFSKAYYHKKCFKERFMKFQQIQDQAQNLLARASPLLQRAEGII